MLLILPLYLHANEIDLSQYEKDVQDVLLDMASDNATVFSDIDDKVATAPLKIEDYITERISRLAADGGFDWLSEALRCEPSA